ncbi:hypothetical protein L7F22_043496 [Adiantum nelumboides]|nr:hypothetical protein [Adiantum nelumboides]
MERTWAGQSTGFDTFRKGSTGCSRSRSMARQPTTAIINATRSCRPALAAAVPLLSSCIFTSTTRGFAMALLRIAGGLSLGPLDCSSRDNLGMNSGFVNNDAFFVKECDSRTHCIHGGGKDSQPAGYMDYLGALPVLETRNATSSVGCDAVFSTKSVPSQLTLFYAGTMNVFDNVTADKAKLIMSVAGGKDLSLQAMDTNGLIGRLLEGSDTALMEPLLTRSVQVQNAVKNKQAKASEVPSAAANSGRLQLPDEGQGHELPGYLVPCQAIVPKALPLARKVSLAQFLERRKDRLRMKAPYQQKVGQGVGCSKASTQTPYNRLWAAPSMYKFGFHPDLGTWNNAEQDWTAEYENSKQASEGESAT